VRQDRMARREQDAGAGSWRTRTLFCYQTSAQLPVMVKYKKQKREVNNEGGKGRS